MKRSVDVKIIQNTGRKVVWNHLITQGITSAASAISQMLEKDIKVRFENLGHIRIDNIPDLLNGLNTPVIVVYAALGVKPSGYILVACDYNTICKILNMINGVSATGSLGSTDTQRSVALGMDIIISAVKSFLNVIGSIVRIETYSLSPVVLIDSAGFILDIGKSEFLRESNSVFIADTILRVDKNACEMRLIIMPDDSLVRLALGGSELDRSNVLAL